MQIIVYGNIEAKMLAIAFFAHFSRSTICTDQNMIQYKASHSFSHVVQSTLRALALYLGVHIIKQCTAAALLNSAIWVCECSILINLNSIDSNLKQIFVHPTSTCSLIVQPSNWYVKIHTYNWNPFIQWWIMRLCLRIGSSSFSEFIMWIFDYVFECKLSPFIFNDLSPMFFFVQIYRDRVRDYVTHF